MKPPAPPDPRRDFERTFRTLCREHQPWRVFADFCEMAAISLAQVPHKDPAREERYLKLVGAYGKDEAAAMGTLLGLVVEGLEDGDHDFLGELFMSLELSSHWKGQFFTPFSLCRTMAKLTIDDELRAKVEERGFVTLHEPAAGAGALVLAFAQEMRAAGLNPQTQLHVTAVDVDPTAAHMAFVQLALCGIPAEVIVGDTLRMEFRESFYTPAHWLGLWPGKLRRGFAYGSKADVGEVPAPAVAPPAVEPVALRRGQLGLFDAPERKAS